MNLDDESQISAFLDDELDPGERLLVAWSIESSPDSARQLADLKAAGALVGGLERPAIPRDLSVAIALEIASSKKPRRRSLTQAGRFAAAIGGVGALAASLMLAVTLLHRSLHDDPNPRLVTLDAPPAHRTNPNHSSESIPQAPSSHPAVSTRQGSTDPIAPSVSTALARSGQDQGFAKSRVPVEPAGVEGPEPARPAQVDAMLGHRKVLRALIVTDVLERTKTRVRSLIEGDGGLEAEFGQITLAQGIVVDPDQPGEAEVYSVVMDSQGCQPFLDRLRREFPSIKVEDEPEPSLVTQLTEVGQVALFSRVRPAQLGSPPGEFSTVVAAKAASTPDHFPAPSVVPIDPTLPRTADLAKAESGLSGVGGEIRRSDPPAAPRHDSALSPLRKGSLLPRLRSKTKSDDEPVTVLVWITRPPKR